MINSKKFFLLFGLFLLGSQSAFAASPLASEESVKQLFAVSNTKILTEQLIATILKSTIENLKISISQSIKLELKGKKMTPGQEVVLKTKFSEIIKMLQKELSWEVIEPITVKAYMEELTQEEVSGILAFYATPAGLAHINKLPRIVQKSQAEMTKHTQASMGEIIKVLKEMNVEFKAAGPKE